ncbi:gp16 family protein [Pseudomonas citronellolis]|uniref:gp16 family protein n=1 Tax=Pseudomonas citronellolis TaxID=53408 RepID=UPI000853BD33|nr:regulatory protein GemA [Pseudomonas humi]
MGLAKGLLSKIHIARQQLGLAEDVYRQKLQSMFGKGSAKDLNLRQAEQLLAEFKRLGWQPRPSAKSAGKPHNFSSPAMPELITKIEAQLADMKLPWAYADALARQMYKVQRVAWLRKPAQLTGLIAALHAEQEKRGLLVEVDQLCQRLGIEHPEQVAGLDQLPEGWRRQRPILKALVDALNAAVEARERKEGV